MAGKQYNEELPLCAGPELIQPLHPLLMLFEKAVHIILDFLLILAAGEQDPDSVGVVLEVRSFVIEDEDDLMLLARTRALPVPPAYNGSAVP